MEAQIKSMIENIDRILKEENPYSDWLKGRHSALKGVKKRLIKIIEEKDEDEEEQSYEILPCFAC